MMLVFSHEELSRLVARYLSCHEELRLCYTGVMICNRERFNELSTHLRHLVRERALRARRRINGIMLMRLGRWEVQP